MMPPDSATRPLLSARPITFMRLVLMPWARAMLPLMPVARRAEPCSVPRYRYSATTRATHTPSTIQMVRLSSLALEVKRKETLLTFTAWFALPIIFRLMEYREIWVRMPARMSGMPSLVCRNPVITPAAMPARKEASSASWGLTPAITSMMHTAPPVAILPSTVRSDTPSMRNVRNTPSASTPQIRPWATPPGRARSSAENLREAKYSGMDTARELSMDEPPTL